MPDLPTRYLGQAPDLRHPLAPPEHVYEVVAEPRPRLSLARALTLGMAALSVVWLGRGLLAGFGFGL